MIGERRRVLPVRWVLGAILLPAAVLKLHQWIVGSTETHLTASDFLLPIVAIVEFFLAVWIVSGIGGKNSLIAATGVFGCFAVVSLWKISQGIGECDCFGKTKFSPKLSYWIDVAAFMSALSSLGGYSMRTWWGSALRNCRYTLPVILFIAIGFYGLGLDLGRNKATEPGNRFGRFWPTSGDIDIPADLTRGRWIVLLYNSSCGHCSSMAADYAEAAQTWKMDGKKTRLALLDSDFGFEPESHRTSPGVIDGKLIQQDLYRGMPVLLLLIDGRVEAVEEGWEEIDWMRPPHSGWIQ